MIFFSQNKFFPFKHFPSPHLFRHPSPRYIIFCISLLMPLTKGGEDTMGGECIIFRENEGSVCLAVVNLTQCSTQVTSPDLSVGLLVIVTRYCRFFSKLF